MCDNSASALCDSGQQAEAGNLSIEEITCKNDLVLSMETANESSLAKRKVVNKIKLEPESLHQEQLSHFVEFPSIEKIETPDDDPEVIPASVIKSEVMLDEDVEFEEDEKTSKNRMSKKREKYSFLNLEQRKEILQIFKCNEALGVKTCYAELARQFKVSHTTIRRMRMMKDSYQSRMDNLKHFNLKRKRFSTTKNSTVEEILYEWYKKKRADGQPISMPILKEKALLINEEIKGDPNFKASTGWFMNFKERLGIRSCSVSGEKISADVENSLEFVEDLAVQMRNNFELSEVYNADETGLLWKILPKTSFVSNFEKDVSEERITLMVCANADGSHKIPLFVIGKSKDPKCFKNINHLPVKYTDQKNAWMTRKLFEEWYTELFLPSVRKFQADRRTNFKKVLLILDNARCHLRKEDIEAIDDMCTVQFLPPDETSLIQPMNQGIIEKMKRVYRRSMLREMISEKDEQSLVEFIKNRNLLKCCIQVASAWSEVTNVNICQAWRKLIPACAIDFNRIELSDDDFIQIIRRVPGFKDVTQEQVSEWLAIDQCDPGYKTLKLQEVIREFQGNPIITDEKSDKDDDEHDDEMDTEESDEETSTDKVLEEANAALNALKVFKNWFQRQNDCDLESTISLQKFTESTETIIGHLSMPR